MIKIFVFTIATLCAYISAAQHTEKLEKLYYQGNYEGCINLLVDDELLAPEDFFIIGNAFHKLQDFETALYYYDMAESEARDFRDYYLNRAICEISLGDVETAERHLFMYEDKVGKHPMVYYYLGVIDYDMLEYKLSREALKLALELDKNYMEAWYLLGAVHLEEQQFNSAVECFSIALELNPNHNRTKLNLAIAEMQARNFKVAGGYLDELISSDEELKTECIYYRAELNFLMHNNEAACADWSLAAEGGDEYAKKALKSVCQKGRIDKHKMKSTTKITL